MRNSRNVCAESFVSGVPCVSQPLPDYNPNRPPAGYSDPPERVTLPPAESAAPPPAPPGGAWVNKATAVLFCVFCFELGVFLTVYPWLDAWADNYLIQSRPALAPFLISHQFRGAVTGLGILNIFIAFGEVFRLRRFSGRQ